VRQAIERLGGEGVQIDNAEGDRALIALNEFVAEMARNAALDLQEGAEESPAQLTDADFEAAFKSLCPGFWPFC
jgi:hypothetical protein